MVRSLTLATFLLFALLYTTTAVAVTGRPIGAAVAVTSTRVITVTTTDDEVNSDGNCSLREAILAAAVDEVVDGCPAGKGGDVIVLPQGHYVLTAGQLEISGTLTISGSTSGPSILDGNRQSRVFYIDPKSTVVLVDLDIRNGQAPTITTYCCDYWQGGGIANFGNALINQSAVHNNHAGSYAAYPYASEGGDGGGIFNGGVLTLTNSTISGNQAGFGAFYGHAGDPSACGGGGSGGGIANFGLLRVENSTIAANSPGTPDCPEYPGNGGGIYNGDAISATIRNSIIAANRIDNCSGELTSSGYNLVEMTEGCAIFGDYDVTDRNWGARLGPLADNGGATLTHALTKESLAVDAGSCADSRGVTVTVDQRGSPRPQGDGCDIGAYESAFTTTFVFRQTALPFVSFTRSPCIVSLKPCNLTQNTLQDDVDPSWLPDGSQIVFTRRGAGHFSMNADGSQPQLITILSDSDQPTWSPDGNKIAYTSDSGSHRDIYVMNTDGSHRVNLTNFTGSAGAINPVWSPDSSKILYGYFGDFTRTSADSSVLNVDLYVMNVDGSQKRLIATDAGTGASPWSPDGSKIVYAGSFDAAGLHIVDSYGANRVDIWIPGKTLGSPAWSPDGKSIAYECVDVAPLPHTSSDICVMGSDGTQKRNLTNNEIPEFSPIWSPDGSKLLFQADYAARSYLPQSVSSVSPDFVVMNADGSQLTRLTFTPVMNITGAAAWAPDSHKIAYASNVTGDFEIYVLGIEP